MVFKVPQFIEVEDKIFGPLTFKQFLYIGGGAGSAFVLWSLLPHLVAVLLIVPFVGLALALAFFRVNERPFVILMESFLRYQTSGKLYLWRHTAPKSKQGTQGKTESSITGQLAVPQVSGSRLHDLAWNLDVNETTLE